MKYAILAAAALAQLALAQPHRNAHQRLHNRDADVVTQVDVTTVITPEVVYVNAAGQPVSTSYAATAAAPAASAAVKAPAAKAPAAHVAVENKKPNSSPATSTAVATSAAPAPSKSASSGSSSPLGIAYSPYTGSGDCKSAQQVAQDLAPLDFDMIRIYGTDCNQVANVQAALKGTGKKIFMGIFDLGSVASEVSTIVGAMASDWDMIDTISVGNELVNSGEATVGEVVAALDLARGLLKTAGYSGSVVTVDTFNAIIANPELCQASDYAAANAYCFFDPDCDASQAGSWAVSTAAQIKQACGGKEVVITESGWPSAGIANGAAVPGVSEQQTAISALKSSFPDGGLILFSAYNDLWKTNTPATFDAEQSYGIFGNSASG